jgi:hypothetical protein
MQLRVAKTPRTGEWGLLADMTETLTGVGSWTGPEDLSSPTLKIYLADGDGGRGTK